MTATPLPPLPATGRTVFHEPAPHRFSAMPVYTADQMQAYARQARADLEAENKRLREALRIAHDHIDMNALRVSHCTDAATITAALESKL